MRCAVSGQTKTREYSPASALRVRVRVEVRVEVRAGVRGEARVEVRVEGQG
tara:strand:+ start:288 stop:440 length:153 start_codon:yes stop_codon:yes gene_type:complete